SSIAAESDGARREETSARQESIEFGSTPHDESPWRDDQSLSGHAPDASRQSSASALDAVARNAQPTPATPAQGAPGASPSADSVPPRIAPGEDATPAASPSDAVANHAGEAEAAQAPRASAVAMPPLNSATRIVRRARPATPSPNTG